jgi:hypothetical protein
VEDDVASVICQALDCGDLGNLVKERSSLSTPLTEGDLWNIFSQLCSAVAHMVGLHTARPEPFYPILTSVMCHSFQYPRQYGAILPNIHVSMKPLYPTPTPAADAG